jgi:hypothetical protein
MNPSHWQRFAPWSIPQTQTNTFPFAVLIQQDIRLPESVTKGTHCMRSQHITCHINQNVACGQRGRSRPEIANQRSGAADGNAAIAGGLQLSAAELGRGGGQGIRRFRHGHPEFVRHFKFDGIAQKAVTRPEANAMPAGCEGGRAHTIGLPGAGTIGGHNKRVCSETIDFDEDVVSGQVGLRRFEIAAEIFVFEGMESGGLGAVVYGGTEMRRSDIGVSFGWLRPSATAYDGCTLVAYVF